MLLRITFMLAFIMQVLAIQAQDSICSPVFTGEGTLLGITPPLRDLPPISEAEWNEMVAKANEKLLNPKLRTRTYPFAETALPKGPDAAWQKTQGGNRAALSDPIVNFQAQSSPYFPPDEIGAAGPNHYMQALFWQDLQILTCSLEVFPVPIATMVIL